MDSAISVLTEEVLYPAAILVGDVIRAAVGEQHPTGPDPLFGEDVEARFRELRRRITLEAQVPR